MYLSTTDSIVGHRIVRTVGPVWGIGDAYHDSGYYKNSDGSSYHRDRYSAMAEANMSIKEAMESLLESVREAGANGVINLTQTALTTGNTGYGILQSVYILMGTAVMVE